MTACPSEYSILDRPICSFLICRPLSLDLLEHIHDDFNNHILNFFLNRRHAVVVTTHTSSVLNLTAIIIAAVISSISLCFCCISICLFILRRRQTRDERSLRKQRISKLATLPIHKALIDGLDSKIILNSLSANLIQSDSAKDRGEKIFFHFFLLFRPFVLYFCFYSFISILSFNFFLLFLFFD